MELAIYIYIYVYICIYIYILLFDNVVFREKQRQREREREREKEREKERKNNFRCSEKWTRSWQKFRNPNSQQFLTDRFDEKDEIVGRNGNCETGRRYISMNINT